MKIWTVGDGSEVKQVATHSFDSAVTAVAFAPCTDRVLLAVGSETGDVSLFQLNEGHLNLVAQVNQR